MEGTHSSLGVDFKVERGMSMFEDSVFASRRQQREVRARWAVIGALAVQGIVVAAALVAPMLRPEALTMVAAAPVVDLTALRKVVQPKVEVRPKVAMVARGVSVALAAAPAVLVGRGARKITNPDAGMDGPAVVSGGPGMGSGTGLPGILTGSVAPAVVVARSAGVRRVPVSGGVSSGMLLAPIHVVYPTIAKAAHVEGTVVLTAVIDRGGRIAGLKVMSGPVMLRTAALEAVREARYRPYLLNGEATEVETMVSVNFRLGG